MSNEKVDVPTRINQSANLNAGIITDDDFLSDQNASETRTGYIGRGDLCGRHAQTAARAVRDMARCAAVTLLAALGALGVLGAVGVAGSEGGRSSEAPDLAQLLPPLLGASLEELVRVASNSCARRIAAGRPVLADARTRYSADRVRARFAANLPTIGGPPATTRTPARRARRIRPANIRARLVEHAARRLQHCHSHRTAEPPRNRAAPRHAPRFLQGVHRFRGRRGRPCAPTLQIHKEPACRGVAAVTRWRLASGDASFVQVVHTSAGVLGLAEPLGHADVYANGVLAPQPECEDRSAAMALGCDHAQAWRLYAASVSDARVLSARRCANWAELNDGGCAGAETSLGYSCSADSRGLYLYKSPAPARKREPQLRVFNPLDLFGWLLQR
ncbi:Lipase member H-B [Papilio xuthus]|uniref:Lipase member H-B n=1 Tax=Papilio xuthus TaxID=66420 RepID=A0A194PVY3_PAPXU|nr:Lipase member H-B [Papilio xuthus]